MSDLSFEDQTDFENAERGRIDALSPCVVKAADGRVVWDKEADSYLDGSLPLVRCLQSQRISSLRVGPCPAPLRGRKR
jgi:alkyl sulfatase BDS1-like metallo-beta-lactamase superfamily hydrolase